MNAILVNHVQQKCICIVLVVDLLLHIQSAFLYSVGCGLSETCCCKKSSTHEWSDILFVVRLLCVEFFLSTALSGIDNSLHDGEAVK